MASISGYQPPELLIRQTLQNVDSTERERLSALVIGPQYVWPDPATDTLVKTAVSADPIVYDLAYTTGDEDIVTSELEGYRVDTDSVKVYLEGAEYALHTPSTMAATAELGKPNELRLSSAKILRSTDGSLSADFRGRDIQVGDTVYLTESATSRTAKRKVLGLLGQMSEATYTSATNYASNPIATIAVGNTKVSGPANTTTIVGGVTALDLADVIDQHLINGWKFTDSNGSVRAGTKATIRILSYNSGAGTAVVSYEDGLTSSVIADFTFAAAALTFANGDIPRVGDGATDEDDLVITYMAGQTPAVGDTFVITNTIEYTRATVTQFLIGDAFGATVPEKDNRFYIKVKFSTGFGGADNVFTVYDRLGLVPATDVLVDTGTDIDIPFGDTGLTVAVADLNLLDQGGVRTGDVYYFDYTAPVASTTDYDGVLLDGAAAIGNASAQTLTAKFRRSAAGEVLASDFVDSTLPVTVDQELGTVSLENTIAWTKNVDAFGTGYKYPVIVANGDGVTSSTVYVTWRAAKIPAVSEGVIQITSVSDLEQLGKLDPDNDLAFGAFAALQGAAGKSVYAIRTAGDTVEDFAEALEKIERHDYTYALAPLTTNKAVGKVVALHCEAMSAEDVKNFRRAYFGVDSPGDYVVVDVDSDDQPYTATVTAYSGGNLRVTFVEDLDLNALGVRAGDYIVLDGTNYTVASVLPSGTELILKTGPAFPYTTAAPVQVWRKDSAASQASYIKDVANYIGSRRCPVVWVEGGTTYDADGNLIEIPTRFSAAYIAGKRSATTAWLGLSRAPVSFLVTAAPMYLKYSRTVLNDIASNGVFILTQAVEDGPVYVRHQLTSDVSNGSLAYEDSIGTNIDDLSFQFKDAFEPLIGITNVTPETLRVAEHRGQAILVDARTSEMDPLIGPQIIQFYNELLEPGTLTVKAHPRFKDRILCKVQVEVPLPNNTTIVEINAVSGISL
jgi:hypothetical protein